MIGAVARAAGGRFARGVSGLGRGTRRRFAPGRVRPALYAGSVLDDFLFAQPFNPIMRIVHRRGRRRRTRPGGVSVVVVNWNTRDVLETVLGAVVRHSPADTELIVIDNGSTDGSREWLRQQDLATRCLLLPFNIGHGRGLDLGFALATGETVVTLDSDAFPYSDGWLEPMLDALRDPEVRACGMWGRRDRLHPACAAIRRDAYFAADASFTNHTPWLDTGEPPVFGETTWDTGEWLSEQLGREHVVLLAVEASPHGGLTMADVVYHHERMTTVQTDEPEANAEVRARRWHEAVADLLGD